MVGESREDVTEILRSLVNEVARDAFDAVDAKYGGDYRKTLTPKEQQTYDVAMIGAQRFVAGYTLAVEQLTPILLELVETMEVKHGT